MMSNFFRKSRSSGRSSDDADDAGVAPLKPNRSRKNDPMQLSFSSSAPNIGTGGDGKPSGWILPNNNQQKNGLRVCHGSKKRSSCIHCEMNDPTTILFLADQSFALAMNVTKHKQQRINNNNNNNNNNNRTDSLSSLNLNSNRRSYPPYKSNPYNSSSLYPTKIPSESTINVADIFNTTPTTTTNKISISESSSSPNSINHSYYFEVAITEYNQENYTNIWIGIIADGDHSLMTTSHNHESSQQLPGETKNSIALCCNGELKINGRRNNSGTRQAQQSYTKGDTIGFGVEIVAGKRHFFITKNSHIIIKPLELDFMDSIIRCKPVIGIHHANNSQQPTIIEINGNFDGAPPFLWDNKCLQITTTTSANNNNNNNNNSAVTMDRSQQKLGLNYNTGIMKGAMTSHLNNEDQQSSPARCAPMSPVLKSNPSPISLGRKSRGALEDDIPTPAQTEHLEAIPSDFTAPQKMSPISAYKKVREENSSNQKYAAAGATAAKNVASVPSIAPSRDEVPKVNGRTMPSLGKPSNKKKSLEDDDEEDDQKPAAAEKAFIDGADCFDGMSEDKHANVFLGQHSSSQIAGSCREKIDTIIEDVGSFTPTSGDNAKYGRNIIETREEPNLVLDQVSSKTSDEDIINAAIEESKKEISTENYGVLKTQELETIRENTRTLRSLCADDGVDISVLEGLLECCRADQQTVKAALDTVMRNEEIQANLMELLTLNDIVLDAVSFGKEKIKSSRKRASSEDEPNLEIGVLVANKDVFSLICILRAQHETRLDAAVALMKFARDDELSDVGNNRMRLRDEIRSSGGMHSLVTFFRCQGISHELRVVAALAVAYVLPCYVESSLRNPTSLSLKIMQCLRFLTSRDARAVTPNGERITREEMYKASALGVTSFWINELAPILTAEKEKSPELHAQLSHDQKRGVRIDQQLQSASSDQRQQSLELQELLEMTVSLIVHIERLSNTGKVDIKEMEKSNSSLFNFRYTLVEQVCAVDVARPIAVREGILPILVGWMKSKDKEKIHPAASALRYLTLIEDKYMAGWIHSQMVNEGALVEVVKLADDYFVGQDVRLAVAQILSSLCVAPHTRAAVAETKCINYLIGFLYDHSDQASQEVALFSGSAIMQLAAGAISRASVFGKLDMELLDFVSPDKRDSLVDDIVNSGAIGSFITIALEHEGKLRSMAIEAIRVLSEDTSLSRRTRLQLCEDGAATALGKALKDITPCIVQGFQAHIPQVEMSADNELIISSGAKDIHGALCALANMLDPVQDDGLEVPSLPRIKSNCVGMGCKKELIEGCAQTADSGGLSSLLWIATDPLIARVEKTLNLRAHRIELVEEAYRCLASLSPTLLSDEAASRGYAKWACDILNAFNGLLNNASLSDERSDLISHWELINSVLLGLGALATYEPLKIRIVDQSLSSLVHLKNLRGDQSKVSNAASQVFLALGFSEDEIAVQVAASNPSLLAEWFCLQRSLIIQAMARSEIRKHLMGIWNEPFKKIRSDDEMKLIRGLSCKSLDDTDYLEESSLFESFANDDATSSLRSTMLRQYQDVYGAKVSPNASVCDSGERSKPENNKREDIGLLSSHVYPLNENQSEINWILSHQKSVASKSSPKSPLITSLSSPEHVEKLLDNCFPSKVLRNQVLPVFDIQPDASFNFRALMLAQRRYFSFRREGQLVSRLCEKQAETVDSDVHWTLGFTNSTFAGEFSQTLVQALYLCPMIRGLSFARTSKWTAVRDVDKVNGEDDGGSLLANLGGSLPPWINSLTFENIFNDLDMRSLVSIIEKRGELSATSFAIRLSPLITSETWQKFADLLGRKNSKMSKMESSPLSSLKILDISGNMMGDEMCASILSIAYDRNSGCSLEQLDLSGNGIDKGAKVVKVLQGYVAYQNRDGWKSSLSTLILSKNALCRDQAALEIIALLKHNALGLKVLDLSNNGLRFADADDEHQFCQTLAISIHQNTSLRNLNLSDNMFNANAIDVILEQLTSPDIESGLAFLGFDNNSPALSQSQLNSLERFAMGSRKVALQRYLKDRELGNLSLIHALNGISDPYSRFSEADNTASKSQHSSEVDAMGRWNQDTIQSTDDETIAVGDNMITVLFSAPLVFSDDQRVLRPFAKLDFEMERELLWQCLKEASRDIELSFDTATHDRLLAATTKRCSCLHYSGHGHQSYLPFEDGSGGPNWFKVEDIKQLIARDGGAPFKFVFVSACYSGLAGETFASAGVPHVVCCQQESELKDAAALAFTRQFYLALAVGQTVKESFEQGCKAVRASPNLRDAEKEMQKFILLPRNGNHDMPVFRAKPIADWPKKLYTRTSVTNSKPKRGKHVMRGSGNSKTSELSVRNMMQEDPSPTPPQFFMGREVYMYQVLKAVLSKRFVSVVGEPGLGRSSLVCALCHYINERASTIIAINEIYFVKAKLGRLGSRCRNLTEQLAKKIVEAGKAPELPESGISGMDTESLFDFLCKSLKNEKTLIVFDRVDLLEGSDDEQEFLFMLLRNLFRGTKNAKVLITGRGPLGMPALGGQVEKSIQLLPLDFANTVRLFANLCPHLHTPADRRKIYEQLAKYGDQTDLLPTDPCTSERTKRLFRSIGDGIPSKIEEAAYGMNSNTLRELFEGV